MSLPKVDTSKLFDVAGKSAIVVGATGSFGKVRAATLGDAGARLAIAAGNAKNLAGVGDGLRAAGVEAVEVARRPDTADDCDAIVDAAVEAYGGVDILVVASGFNEVSPIVDMGPERFEKIMRANVDGPWLIARSAGRQMIEQGSGGKVVFTSSARPSRPASARTCAWSAAMCRPRRR